MDDAINCSVSDIDDFECTVTDNMREIDDIFSAERSGLMFSSYIYHGMLENIYTLLADNASAVDSVGKESLQLIDKDIFSANDTLNHDRKALDRRYADLKEIEVKIGRQTEVVRRCASELKQCQAEQTKVNLQTVSGYGEDQEAARRAKEEHARDVRNAQTAVNVANHNYLNAKAYLAQLKATKQALEAEITKIEDIIKKLESLISELSSKRGSIQSYMDSCKSQMGKLEDKFKRLADKYIYLENTIKKYQDIAFDAKIIVKKINQYLSKASDSEPSETKNIQIKHPSVLTAFSRDLLIRKEQVQNHNFYLLELLERIDSTLQDNVTIGAIALSKQLREKVDGEISDFEEKSQCLAQAANALKQYTQLI